MNNDEEPLYASVLDPSEASTAEVQSSDSNNGSTPSADTPPLPPTAPAVQTRWFILEPAVFLVFLGMYLCGAVYQNQLLYQTCIYVYQYNASQCTPLLGVEQETEEAKRIETEVQPYVSRILMARSLLESILPAIVSLFIGPWSDKFGRRPVLLSTFTGYCTGSVIITTLSLIASKNVVTPWIFLLSSVPSVLSGGTCALITGIYCYISDVASEKRRALRMVLNEASLSAGMMIGNVAGGYIYAATNVVTIFAIATICMFCAWLYVYIFVVESLKPEQIQEGSKIREFFRFDLVKDLVTTCFQRRANFDRAIIWLVMIALTLAIFTMEGDSNVTYLFLREKFNCTVKDYALFNSSRIVIQIVGSIIGMIIMRRILKFSIITMTMIAFACCVLESTVRATAVYWWEMYLGMSLGFMRGILGPMARAILSHVAPSTEVGKIFALTTSLESLSPLGAAPLYTSVYNATLRYYPGLFNFISAGIYMIGFTLITTIFGIQKSLADSSSYRAIGA